MDCYKYDSGQSDYSNIWNTSGSANLERKGDYSEITEKTTGTNGVLQVSIPPINICVEFDFKLLDGTKNDFFYQFSQGSTYLNGSNFNYSGLNFDTEWHHCKIIIGENTNNNNTQSVYIDNANKVTRTMNNYTLTNNILFSFWTAGDITTIDFKNWKCYPI